MGPHQVRGQQVGSELDAAKAPANGPGKACHGHGLGESGQPLQKHMTVGQQAYEEPFDELLLTDTKFS